MKGYKITKPFTLEEKEILETQSPSACSKVKVNKALITLSDLLRYRGELDGKDVVLGGSGIGIVTETDANLFGLEKGKHIYIDPTKACDECYNCKRGAYSKCSDLLFAGEDFDGFLSDFIIASPDKLYPLPASVSDFESLFIGHISLAISIFDKLGIQKGDYVAVLGANNFGNIFAQLLIYYQAVPIVMTLDEEDYEIAKKSGIYYVLGASDNWQKEVSAITGGRMTDKIIYISDSNIPTSRAFALAPSHAKIAFTGEFYKSSPVSFSQAVRKQLDILCLNSGYGNTGASINLIANKAIDFSNLKIQTAKYNTINETFNKLNEQFEKDGKIYETVIDMM